MLSLFMKEKDFQPMLHSALEKRITDYKITPGKNLLYGLNLNSKGDLQPANYNDPKRGYWAFQTDLLIHNEDTPLVVLELKCDGFSTNDVLAYSGRAVKHKSVFPFLRYGLVAGNQKTIDRKFFVLNDGFDFAFACNNIEADIDELVDIIYAQIKSSEMICKLLENRKGKLPKSYSQTLNFL